MIAEKVAIILKMGDTFVQNITPKILCQKIQIL